MKEITEIKTILEFEPVEFMERLKIDTRKYKFHWVRTDIHDRIIITLIER